ncbi:hypothetical protein B0A69_04205 [Chryseobacterium shigense]|uniref:DUF4846 domain-containing protein n=1 Tax=Chryseobacterium shigense TaxID=297244 RepID=A0A1N7IRA3_9FLAO|nr:DUF4846 domain-containing protein [Chryseobacterium shigense]PQA95588.1 hypothetical protein B0A69_04205 [Chryseobacterium shigense]SIS39516.1 protein of unknown function (4846) [Chryseobacterium shigense]
MKKNILILILTIIISSCSKDKKISGSTIEIPGTQVSEGSVQINKDKNTIRERFSAPEGYTWAESQPGSFGYFIENFKLKPYGTPILKYDGTPIATQDVHEAVFDIDTGNKDLQQCADAAIRLRAEYLYKAKKFDEIRFHFTSGDLVSWNDYKNGIRAFVNGNSVSFRKTADFDDSYPNFRKYLDLIFNYAGTISLNKETKPVAATSDLKTGDILITPGSPGHIVFISGVCQNKEGEKLFLLSQGFTPAQSIHMLSNPFDKNISSWYRLDVNSSETKTARYFFKPTNFRSF